MPPGADDDDADPADDTRAAEAAEPASDAFALVGNEIRAEIIRVLGDARVAARVQPVLTFTELRERIDPDVRSSRFNYHLQKLVGVYVTSTEDGYRMRNEGRVLYQTLRAGTFNPQRTTSIGDAGFDCYFCDTRVGATIDEGAVQIQCPDCDYLYGLSGAPPGAVEDEAVDLDQVERFYHHRHLAFARGLCITCGNEPGIEFLPGDAFPYADPERSELYVYRGCENCGDQRHLSLGTALLPTPVLVEFCRDHGVDVLDTPLWELEFAATDRGVTIHSRDPWEVSLAVEYDDETLELVVDDDLTILEQTRR